MGTIAYHWQNDASNIVDQKYKKFVVNVFYPNARAATKKFAYQPDKINALKTAIPRDSRIPGIIWDKLLNGIHTLAEPNAPIARSFSKYPVLISLPGIGGEGLNTVYLEELASHGYVIFAIDPPYDLLAMALFGNKIVSIDPILKEAIKQNNRTEIYRYRNDAHVRWTQYINSTLSSIKELNNNKKSIFYQTLDLDKIGLIGHSHGGAVVTDVCQKNKFCKAGVNMDGWTKTYNEGQAFEAPFLFLLSESGEMPEMQELFRNNSRADFKKITIKGAGHSAFSDRILTKQPLAQWLGIVSKDPNIVRKGISERLVMFFNRYLNNT